MKPIFTIHAGEYLVGNLLEKKLKNCELWIPSKDTGTDLLVTNKKDRSKQLGLQVKYSKDFLPEMNPEFHQNLIACGWWTLNSEKIRSSNADYWILTPYSFVNKEISLIIITPEELISKLEEIHLKSKKINVYLWVTKDEKCFETRGFRKNSKMDIIERNYGKIDDKRDFTSNLNNWDVFDIINSNDS